MKKFISISVMLILFVSAYSQEALELKFVREKTLAGAGTNITVKVNGTEVGKLENGETESYTVKWEKGKAVVIEVSRLLSRKEISVMPDPSGKMVLNANFKTGFVSVDLVSGGKIVQGTGETSGANVNKNNMAVSYTAQAVNSTDTVRQQWIDKGGKIFGISFTTAGSYTGMSDAGMKFRGTGLSFNLTTTFLKFTPPEYKEGWLTWKSTIAGFSATNQFMGTKTENEIPGMDPMKMSMVDMNFMLSLNIGYTLGFGKFKTETTWKGAALDLTYRPSFILTFNEVGGGAAFNAAGFGLDVNFNSFTSNASRLAPKAQSKITLFMLPPIGDNPLFITVGYGVTFYKKRS